LQIQGSDTQRPSGVRGDPRSDDPANPADVAPIQNVLSQCSLSFGPIN
jgi:hypothetical protein